MIKKTDCFYKVRQGDTLWSIGVEHGLQWQTIWDDARNTNFRECHRNNPNILYPGELLFIPERSPHDEDRPTDSHHRFELKHQQPKLKLRFLRNFLPRKSLQYEMQIIGVDEIWSGMTNGEGEIEERTMPADASFGWLRLYEGEVIETYLLHIGSLDPTHYRSGALHRLHNLGFCSYSSLSDLVRKNADDSWNESEEAVYAFQKYFEEKHGLCVTGQIDKATETALDAEY